MLRRFVGFTCVALAFTVSTWQGGTVAAPTPRTSPSSRWEPLLTWLPEDTETLIVTPLGFEIPKDKPEDKGKQFHFPLTIQELPTGLLTNFKEGFLNKQLSDLKVLCAVEGSRHFTRPGEFGLMPYEGCHILQFDPEEDERLKKIIQAIEDKADKKIELLGVKVAEFSETHERDRWSYYVCRPRRGILICATNRNYLEETLKRIDAKPSSRAFPADLPEWKHVDVKACTWGMRHYRKEFAQEDPTSPLNENGRDKAAVGVVFWAHRDIVEIRYLSKAKKLSRLREKNGRL